MTVTFPEDSGVMASKPALTDSGRPPSLDLIPQQIQRFVREYLAGRKGNVVIFMEELLAIARQVGELRCSRAGDHGLRFELRGREPFEVDLDANRGKLRMLCARLAVLCQESGSDFMPYGGEGIIRQTWNAEVQKDDINGSAGESIPGPVEWRARWMNTPDRHDFTIQCECVAQPK